MKNKVLRTALVICLLILFFVPSKAYAYNESYSQSGISNGYGYTCSGTCNEFYGTARTQYGRSVFQKLDITGYYVYLENGVARKASGNRIYTNTSSSINKTVYPSTFQSINTGYAGMCKVTTRHYANGSFLVTGTAQFQNY